MPKSTDCCNKILDLMYRAGAWATVADNAASTPLTSVYLSFASTSPTAGSNAQNENEAAYTNYARKQTSRSATDWAAASGGITSNVQLLQFPQSGATGGTLHSTSTGVAASGATAVWHYGALNSPITIGASASITPQFLAGAYQIQET